MRNRPIKVFSAAIAAGIAATLFVPGVASAGWARSSSDLDTSSNDISLCEDEMTFETEYRANPVRVPGVGEAVGTPWPNDGGVDTLSLYGTAADATTATNPIATVTTALFQTEFVVSSQRHVFKGQATIPTPAGYENGDEIFVSVFNNFQFPLLSQALTIGDPKYNCVEPVEPINISATAFKPARRVFMTFPTSNVSASTIQVSANNGTPASPEFYASFYGKSLVVVRFNSIGLNCATTSIVMTATTTGGQQLRGEQPLKDPRCPA